MPSNTTPPALRLAAVLRHRRKLALAEVVRLGAGLPALLDAAGPDTGTAPLLEALECVWLDESDARAPLESWLERDLREWPPFALRVAEVFSGDTVPRRGPLLARTELPSPVQRLAALFFELLGGRHRPGLERALPPLPALNDPGNAALQRALHGQFADCQTFWREWLAVLGERLEPAARELWIPANMLGLVECCDVLRLAPRDAQEISIRLVARDVFRIGRSRQRSDLPVTIESPAGEATPADARLSRVHVLAERSATGITLRDGDGQGASANGATFDHVPLEPTAPLAVHAPGRLELAGLFALSVIPIRAERIQRCRIANLASWRGRTAAPATARAQRGAVLFLPLEGHRVSREAVWLHAEIVCAVSGARLVWSQDGAGPLAFLHRHGAFWLANLDATDGPRIDGRALERGGIAPLVPGQSLDFGGARFSAGAV